MFGYSLIRAGQNQPFFKALMEELPRSAFRSKGLHTETGPGVFEAAILYSDALEAADRGSTLQDCGEGDRPPLRHHAELHGEVEHAVSRLQRPHATRACPTARATCSTTSATRTNEQAVRELPRRSVALLLQDIQAMFRADHQQLQAAGRRLLGAGQTRPGAWTTARLRLRVIPGSSQVDAARDALCGRRHQSVPRVAACVAAGPLRHREGAEAQPPAAVGATARKRAKIPRLPRT